MADGHHVTGHHNFGTSLTFKTSFKKAFKSLFINFDRYLKGIFIQNWQQNHFWFTTVTQFSK